MGIASRLGRDLGGCRLFLERWGGNFRRIEVGKGAMAPRGSVVDVILPDSTTHPWSLQRQDMRGKKIRTEGS